MFWKIFFAVSKNASSTFSPVFALNKKTIVLESYIVRQRNKKRERKRLQTDGKIEKEETESNRPGLTNMSLLLLAYCFRGKELPILTRVGRKKERKQRNEEIRIVKTTQRKEARKKERNRD